MVVRSYAELGERLRAFLEHPGGAEGLYCGRARRTDPALSALIADEDMSAIVATWLAQGKYAKALELWVNGFALDWSGLHPEGTARVVAVPTYTFARERYWIGDKPIDGLAPDIPLADEEGAAVGGVPDSVIEDVLDDFLSGSLDTVAAAEHIRLSMEDGTGRHTDNGGR